MILHDEIELDQSDGIELSIIIVSFNTREMTLECLRSIEAQTRDTRYEIVVVDNMSTDGSADAIQREFPAINLMASTRNLGFALANNVAAASAHGRRLLLLNPDTIILDRAIDRLVAFSKERPSSRIWGGRTVFSDGSLNPGSCWRRLTVWNLICSAIGLTRVAPNSGIFNSVGYGGWDRSTVRYVDIVTGCLLLIDRNLWDDLGGFDPAFFMYGEEADLCLRACEAGAHPVITPTATIVHYGGASETSSVEKAVRLFRAKVTLINRHWSPLTRAVGRALLLLFPMVRWPIFGLAARATGRSDFKEAAQTWRTIWKRRREWIGGYGLPSVSDSAST